MVHRLPKSKALTRRRCPRCTIKRAPSQFDEGEKYCRSCNEAIAAKVDTRRRREEMRIVPNG